MKTSCRSISKMQPDRQARGRTDRLYLEDIVLSAVRLAVAITKCEGGHCMLEMGNLYQGGAICRADASHLQRANARGGLYAGDGRTLSGRCNLSAGGLAHATSKCARGHLILGAGKLYPEGIILPADRFVFATANARVGTLCWR